MKEASKDVNRDLQTASGQVRSEAIVNTKYEKTRNHIRRDSGSRETSICRTQ